METRSRIVYQKIKPQDSDESLKNVLGIAKPRTFDWFMHEAALGRPPALSIYQGYVHPPVLADEYYEPIGILYGRHKDWERVQQQLISWMQLSSSRLRVDSTNELHNLPSNHLPSAHADKIPNLPAVQMPYNSPLAKSQVGSSHSSHFHLYATLMLPLLSKRVSLSSELV